MSWSVDGFTWNIPCSIDRVSEVESSEISGMMLNRQYFNDVIGTWLRYTITIAVPRGRENDYSELYTLLTAPQSEHEFILPYNEGEIVINARVQTVSDRYVRLPGDKQTWRRTTFDIIATHPSKNPDLSQVGLSPLPEALEPDIGDIYEYTSGGWLQRTYEDADARQY
jgi:hypothetical protein